MTKTPHAPDRQIADAVTGNWIDRFAPVWALPFLRLSRADRPAGTWLLYLPCLWGLMLAMLHDPSFGFGSLWIALGCGLGAFLMRGAGCAWNDITDRKIDAGVTRTKTRPLPAGDISVRAAVIWMCLQCLLAFCILLTFPPMAIALGIAALVPVAIYPFAKRFTWWPQVFLGIAFNWGILLTWTAHRGEIELPAVLLYLAGITWTLYYDTIYALQDIEDDALMGVKSTARLFGSDTRKWLWLFVAATTVFMALAVVFAGSGLSTLGLLLALTAPCAAGLHMVWQMRRLDIHDATNCMHIFRANRETGIIPLIFLGTALLV